tara:strand:+ start:6900 stop:7526 length:627 start_codon:yes stop_codon:yes gene_type:complete
MVIGNIITSENIDIKNYNIINNIDLINNDLPTIIIGWNETKNIVTDKPISILHKKINDNLYWTFTKKERKVDYEKDIINFESICLKFIESKINYIYVDVLHSSKRKIRKILNKIKVFKTIVTYINNRNMLYIFGDNLIFGIDLNICEFIGVKKNKIINKVNSISNVTLRQNEIFNICKDLIKNNREKLIPYIYYNGTNNENNNTSVIC